MKKQHTKNLSMLSLLIMIVAMFLIVPMVPVKAQDVDVPTEPPAETLAATDHSFFSYSTWSSEEARSSYDLSLGFLYTPFDGEIRGDSIGNVAALTGRYYH